MQYRCITSPDDVSSNGAAFSGTIPRCVMSSAATDSCDDDDNDDNDDDTYDTFHLDRNLGDDENIAFA